MRRWVLLLVWCASAWGADVATVVYPAEGDTAFRYRDLRELLQAALDETVDRYGPYRLVASKLPMEEGRSLIELSQGGLDVAWSSTSAEREMRLLAVHVDLRKGLLGYRIALIDGHRQAEFDHVDTREQLKRFVVGQGRDWGDGQIYRAAGIPLVLAKYQSLFGMLSSGRFDLYPRSVLEVFDEYLRFHDQYPNLEVEQHLLFYYPWPYYFFCNRNQPQLAERLSLGLQRMRADGRFDAIFWKYHGDVLRQARMSERRLIPLANPLLPDGAPLSDKTMWYDPLRDHPPRP
ncbi:transporter substrate-binding domain-containing protein [Chromobacterium sp. IIBBL 290-4]|uniref:transporter substrate-binding domain-containing protein n=1 Tax=Chromobacterium sp. IIBBL 290-4 TaxID=2953890 RepID=UPI0020B645F8|nr:transporter substrate-binding domain-containing protein [Chromobacterium sp. IIBBL 290-4]UTH75836.1 transporter substrate-binding domain-containing protein [Chromobacterium sp. IIBBL 290-4]